MHKTLLLCTCLLACGAVRAQPNFSRLTVGLDIGFDVHQLVAGEKPVWIPGVQVEVPLGSLALGLGFGREMYHAYDYYVFAGSTVDRMENGQVVTYYVSNLHSFRPAYWTVPFKAEFRVSRCQCVFLYAGASLDFFDAHTRDRLIFPGAELRQRPFSEIPHDLLFKSRTHSFSLGVGFNLLANDYLRLTARPSFVWSENPEVYTSAPYYITTFRMNFGLQFALFRQP